MMKGEKVEFRFFSIVEWEEEEQYLERKHAEGWKFVRVGSLGIYHFVPCEPEEVVYQLDYNQDGIQHKEEYVQLFKDCGWDYLQDYFGYSYFRKAKRDMTKDENIFCDDESKLDMVKRVYKGRMLPLLIFFGVVIVPQLFIQYQNIDRFAFGFFSYLIVFGLYMFIFIKFGMAFYKLRKRFSNEE